MRETMMGCDDAKKRAFDSLEVGARTKKPRLSKSARKAQAAERRKRERAAISDSTAAVVAQPVAHAVSSTASATTAATVATGPMAAEVAGAAEPGAAGGAPTAASSSDAAVAAVPTSTANPGAEERRELKKHRRKLRKKLRSGNGGAVSVADIMGAAEGIAPVQSQAAQAPHRQEPCWAPRRATSRSKGAKRCRTTFAAARARRNR